MGRTPKTSTSATCLPRSLWKSIRSDSQHVSHVSHCKSARNCFPLQNKFDPTVCLLERACVCVRVCVLGRVVWNLESQAEHEDTTAALRNNRVVEVTALRGSYYPLGLWVSQLESTEGRLSAEHGSMIKYHRWKCFERYEDRRVYSACCVLDAQVFSFHQALFSHVSTPVIYYVFVSVFVLE